MNLVSKIRNSKLRPIKNMHLKISHTNIIILSSTSQRETQQNFLISYRVKKKKILMWVLIGAFKIRQTLFASFQKKYMLCLTENYHITFSTKNVFNEVST